MCDRFDRYVALRGWRGGCIAGRISRGGIAWGGARASGHQQTKDDRRHPPCGRPAKDLLGRLADALGWVRYQPAFAITPLISSAESARNVVVRRLP
jgi:hypothetical protein